MGFITPILFSNDAIHAFEKDPQQVMDIISKACRDNKSEEHSFRIINYAKWWQFWKKPSYGGGYCNYIKSLGTAHADVKRLVFIYGNTWIDLSRLQYGDWERDDETYIKYVESCIKYAQSQLTHLKRIVKEKRSEIPS